MWLISQKKILQPLNRKVVCLSAGTAAVHLALIACGVQAGDEVIVQSFTFCALLNVTWEIRACS